jgi:hypothetical protein
MVKLRADWYRKLTLTILAYSQDIRKYLEELKASLDVIMDNNAAIKDQVKTLQDDAATQRKKIMLDWICDTDYYKQHRDYVDRCHPDTGEWFLNDSKYQDWMRSEESTLFCPGMPGAGKTMMATLVIDRLIQFKNEPERPVVFIYCNYKLQSEQSIKHILSSLLRQIVDIQRQIPQVVQDFHAKDSTPSEKSVKQMLMAVSKDLLGLTVVVDALDECETKTREDLWPIVEKLRQQCRVRLLATSRDLPEITSHATLVDKPTLEVRASDQDLDKYVRSRIGEFRSRSKLALQPDLLETLVKGIVKAAGGM